ncbi:BatA domain-containing protein, partial [Candidatus Babeliales bacterium]|nr:BatA domain-containing protein [Candidatus Babeliales bacterium]
MSLPHFAYPSVFYFFVPVLILLVAYRLRFYKSPFYVFPLTGMLKKAKKQKSQHHKTVFFVLRSLLLGTLLFFMARPQWTDSHTNVNVDGVDIMLALDVSGSMQLFD